VPFDEIVEGAEDTVEQNEHFAGLVAPGCSCEADDIGEQHGRIGEVVGNIRLAFFEPFDNAGGQNPVQQAVVAAAFAGDVLQMQEIAPPQALEPVKPTMPSASAARNCV